MRSRLIVTCVAVLGTGMLVSLRVSAQGFCFNAAVNYAVGAYPWAVIAADLGGDGDQDLAVANQGWDNVSVLKNNGDGTFAPAMSYAAGDGPTSVFAADLDRDGKTDLAVANRASTVSVLRNNGDGTFAAAVNFEVGFSSVLVFAADLNGDGKLDLAVAHSDSNDVSVLINCSVPCSSPHPGDLDGSGFIDVTNVLRVIGVAFVDGADIQDPNCSKTRAVVNDDGVVDVNDVTYIIKMVFTNGPNPVNPCNL